MSACRIIHGHVIDGLRSLPAGSVHCCVTSPPYWGLRKYAGATAQVWGGAAGCGHDWGAGRLVPVGNAPSKQSTLTTNGGRGPQPGNKYEAGQVDTATLGDTCRLCHAYRGDLGLEPTFGQFITNIVSVFREVRRVLRDDGTVALNLGDVFSGGGRGGNSGFDDRCPGNGARQKPASPPTYPSVTEFGLPPKSKLLLPHRVAIALADDGWIVRQDCVWHKRNPLPESVRDRPTTAHEFVFLLAKSARYYWDSESVRVPGVEPIGVPALTGQLKYPPKLTAEGGNGNSTLGTNYGIGTANMRSVLSLAAEPFSAKSVGVSDVDHFAAFPSALVRPFILAGCPERCCPHCGEGWVLETGGLTAFTGTVHALGLRAGCACIHTQGETIPGTVLDPFLGSGTTGEVAIEQFRRAIGCELSADYVRIAKARIGRAVGMFTDGGVTVETVG